MTNPHAEVTLDRATSWTPGEAVRVLAQPGTRAVSDGFVHRAMYDVVYGLSSGFRIIKCQRALVTQGSGWVAVNESVDCLACLADTG